MERNKQTEGLTHGTDKSQGIKGRNRKIDRHTQKEGKTEGERDRKAERKKKDGQKYTEGGRTEGMNDRKK